MAKLLFLLLAAGTGLLLITMGRGRRLRAAPRGPDNLATPLLRELWRQGRTPGLMSPGAESALMPILAFELYTPEARLLYDRSRALDTAMYDLLRDASDPALTGRIQALQTITRGVRRDLVLAALPHPVEPAPFEPDVLGRRLDAVATTIAGLSTGSRA